MIAFAFALIGQQVGPLPVQQKLDQIDRTFVCPEDIPSYEGRKAAAKLFVERLQAIQPDLTVKNLVEYRQTLLVKHRCTKTLELQAQ